MKMTRQKQGNLGSQETCFDDGVDPYWTSWCPMIRNRNDYAIAIPAMAAFGRGKAPREALLSQQRQHKGRLLVGLSQHGIARLHNDLGSGQLRSGLPIVGVQDSRP